MKKPVIIGLSGGVDSSVAAYLIKEQGYEVIALTLKLYLKSDAERAKRVAEYLKIPHFILDLREEFRREIMDYFANEYRKGRTPNPCAFCNPKIKFKYLLKFAVEKGAKFIATGHYAKIIKRGDSFYLSPGKDRVKSQEYFLALLSDEVLKRTLFPMGDLTKEEAREIAKREGIPTEIRKESQDICFIPSGNHADFLRRKYYFSNKKGKFLSPEGKVLGQHAGYYLYTIGQRRGTGVSFSKPLYVVRIDPEKNTVVLGPKEMTYHRRVRVRILVWKGKPRQISKVKLRYRHPAADAKVEIKDNNARVTFKEPQFAPTPGQIAVFYNEDDLVLGAGTIEKVL